MKPSEIREFTDEELDVAVNRHRREIMDLRIQSQTGQLEDTARIRLARRELARLLTEKTNRQRRVVTA